MTHRAVGFGRGFPRAWLVPIGALTILLGVAASGRLSRSIVADLIAWWPVWLALGVTAYLVRDRKVGAFRLAGLVPFLALFFVGLFIWGHLAGWSLMPSASQRLVGPEVDSFTSARLATSIDGRIEVAGDAEFLYQVEPIKKGGGIGIPTADENVADSSIAIELHPRSDPGLYVYAGWDLRLSPEPLWDLDLDGALDADLSGLEISALEVSGSGEVRLGVTSMETPVNVGGSFTISVPDGVPARLVGLASVPASWTLTQEGATTPGGGAGWVITVVGDSSVTVVGG